MEENLEKETKKVLVVDDEQAIIDVLVYNLQKEGYETLEATDGVTAVNIALEQKPDLMLLDIMLPKMDGLTVCKRVKNYLNIPILMLTAKDAEIDKIVGLELGADDYITKPFSVRELMARVKANLRKNEISTIIKLWCSLLCEKHIILLGNQAYLLFAVCESLLSLIFPFKYIFL